MTSPGSVSMNFLCSAVSPSRSQARALIMAGRVLHGTERLDKPGKDYPPEIELRLSNTKT